MGAMQVSRREPTAPVHRVSAAQKRAERIRTHLADAAEEYATAVLEGDWSVLGYDSVAAWAADQFGQHKFKPDARRKVAELLSARGMTTRQIAAASGTSQRTAARDLGDGESPEVTRVSHNDSDAQSDQPERRESAARQPGGGGSVPPVMLTLRTHDGREVAYPQPKSAATFNETKGEGISWAAWSWNPVTGCLHGCDYCYAREIATRFTGTYPAGFEPVFHSERLSAPANTVIPAGHRDEAEPCRPDGCPWRRVFVCSMADLYGRWVPDEWIRQVHAAMLASPQWQYILLTKFPDRYAGLELPPGAWVGTSVDEQKRVHIAERAFAKLDGAAVKWLSLEPLREPLEFTDLSMFDWVVIGAQTATRQPDGAVPESAPPFEWVARIVAQAREAGCAVHLKPNLLGATGPKSPGMVLPDEYPVPGMRRSAPAIAPEPAVPADGPQTRDQAADGGPCARCGQPGAPVLVVMPDGAEDTAYACDPCLAIARRRQPEVRFTRPEPVTSQAELDGLYAPSGAWDSVL